jgi:hypothetical protein
VSVSLAMEPEVVEARLAAGQLRCGGCAGALSPWGYGRARDVRMLCGVQRVRPRRAYCRACQATHLLLPAWSLPRRRDGAEVIGRALELGAQGAGHRTVARRLDRAPGTVRGWLRAARRGAPALYRSGLRWTLALDPAPPRLQPVGRPLADAVEALGCAVRGWRLRFGPRARWGPWELAVGLTDGGLLCGCPRDPPGLAPRG